MILRVLTANVKQERAAALYGLDRAAVDRPGLLPGAVERVSDLRTAHYEALDIEPYDF